MPKQSLILDENYYDFELFGIITGNIPDYQFIFELNKKYESFFRRIDDLDLTIKGNTYFFSCYEWVEPEKKNIYHLIKNLSNIHIKYILANTLEDLFTNQVYLVPELKNYTYLIKSYGSGSENPFLNLSLAHNQMRFQIESFDLQNIRSKENLIF